MSLFHLVTNNFVLIYLNIIKRNALKSLWSQDNERQITLWHLNAATIIVSQRKLVTLQIKFDGPLKKICQLGIQKAESLWQFPWKVGLYWTCSIPPLNNSKSKFFLSKTGSMIAYKIILYYKNLLNW